mmetsp:Transcript_11896/g.51222  ORF Transcript_11896/g.51222 Transcript_11896/m.51222 type:complete len:295 (+) Transcript_11896:1798-2682(+)
MFIAALSSSNRRLSFSFSTFMWSKCSLTRARSLVEISSLSCSIWWFMILNLRFISAISSCASSRFLLYMLRSVRTASYMLCCALSFAFPSAMLFCRSTIAISRIFTSSSASRNFAVVALASLANFSRSCSKPKIAFACFEASDRYPAISCSSVFLLFSVMRTRSACFCVADSACDLSLVRTSLSRMSSSCFFFSSSPCLRMASMSRSRSAIVRLRSSRFFSTSALAASAALSFPSAASLALSILPASSLARLISSSFALSSICALALLCARFALFCTASLRSLCSLASLSLRPL